MAIMAAQIKRRGILHMNIGHDPEQRALLVPSIFGPPFFKPVDETATRLQLFPYPTVRLGRV
jgi:hypothetical protein